MFGLEFNFIFIVSVAFFYSMIRDANTKYIFPKIEIIKTYLDIVKDKYDDKLFFISNLNINDEIKNNVYNVIDGLIFSTAFVDFDEYIDQNEIFYSTLYNKNMIYSNTSLFNETYDLLNENNIQSNKHRIYYLNFINGVKGYTDFDLRMNDIFLKDLFSLSEVYFKFVNDKLKYFNFSYSNVTYIDNIDLLNKIVSDEIKNNYEFNSILNNIDYEYQNQLLEFELIKFNNISSIPMQPTQAPI